MKNKVKEYRQQYRLTQQEVADLVGVSSRTIISLEKGQYNPSLMLAYRLALLFHTSVEDLYCLAENKQAEDHINENSP
ncbi:MAG: helix-turn-helix transcriptional regulator [Pygmaiobacter massiliensis]|nr:helix-turn-helix transcriptional regulator [Pygmaiobacter massiliensis]